MKVLRCSGTCGRYVELKGIQAVVRSDIAMRRALQSLSSRILVMKGDRINE